MKTAVIVFPGSNCDRDNVNSWYAVTGLKADLIWHKESHISDYDLIIIPGGFSFGDYLRTGCVARFSPIMKEVARQAAAGRMVLGICNGFQILTEAGLLPGALMRNRDLKYLCKDIFLRVENNSTPFTCDYALGQILRLPISHGEGNYFVGPEEHKRLVDEGRIVFRYSSPEGQVYPNASPNGSLDAIAGVINQNGNVMGLMPHPERLAEDILGGTDGRALFTSILNSYRLAPTKKSGAQQRG
ncbi:MAG: phosphoribosylformylglycinamidine synthase subunit PurQ [Deltaproteobacteria bacterium]|nr:phosphoribosylformylglycinamidine synthase subunit PurQ [Deltaproteobacteria bacterium]